MSQANSQPEPKPTSTNLVGQNLGNFRVLRRLGQGAMADVYLAEQSPLGRFVAVKILKSHLAGDPTYLKRFEREARAAASLVHANIVQIYEVGNIDGFQFIAEEYVAGQNLRQWINRKGTPDIAHAISVMRQAAAALIKAAEQGIVHRDIKPENIMLTCAGEVKIADFGLAQIERDGDAVNLTQVGVTLGTPLYMSPEQVEGRQLDPRSDIYSLGVTSYHLLAGKPPFDGDTVLSIAVQHLSKEPQPIAELRPELPEELCRIVHRMLAKDPDKRYGSASELLRDLRQFQHDHFGSHWPDNLPDWGITIQDNPAQVFIELTREIDSLMKKGSRGRGRRALIWTIAGCAALLLGGTAGWLFGVDDPLLAGSNGADQIPHHSSALRQWVYASQIGTPEAWQSVVDYVPKNEYLIRRAKQQLARFYLQERNYEQAMAVFQDLATMAGDGDEEFRAFGLAGVGSVLSLEGRYQESANVLDDLWPIRSKLRDQQMRQLLDYSLKRNRQKAESDSTQKWQQWIEDQFRVED